MRQYFYSGVVITETGHARSEFHGLITVTGEGLMADPAFAEIIQNITTNTTKVSSDRIILRAFNLLHQTFNILPRRTEEGK